LVPAALIKRENFWSLAGNIKVLTFVYISTALNLLESIMVDKDRSSAEQAKGKVKEVVGKVTGDRKLASEGKAGQVKGKVQNAVGGLKDSLRGK
jgi:uncharacterized protein YjbJ (UPF0337 family)